jgi:hypothetical protein
VTLDQGGLAAPITHDISVSDRNVITIDDPADDRLKLKVKATNGLVTGSFVHPGRLKPPTSIFGVFYQKQNPGARGLFIGPTAGGTFSLAP